MLGKPILDFVPLHLSVVECSPSFKDWFGNVLGDLSAHWMTPEHWFEAPVMGIGTYVWTPPPAAGDVVVDQLGLTKLREPGSLHFIILPNLLTGRWRRWMTRGCDCYEVISCKQVWDIDQQFEPLIMFVSLPLNPPSPNSTGQVRWVEEFHRILSRVSEVSWAKTGVSLRKLCAQA